MIFRRNRKPKVFIVGLDCAAPELVFQRWRSDLPNLSRLADGGVWGDLESCTPAITVPAWSCMLSGRDPGELGVYGFRNRLNHSYRDRFIATSRSIRERRLWDYLSQAGKQSVIIGVPQTFPVSPLNGNLVSSFLTPSIKDEFTYPASLKQEVLSVAPDYDFDVRQFRTDDKTFLLEQIWTMTEKRFQVVDYLLANKPWDLFMLMEIGVDRIHHGFWSYHDPRHRRYRAGNPFENAIHDYYVRIDQKIGEWLKVVGDDTVVVVVSDHGAQRMDGGICLNEWLWRNGYLAFKSSPPVGEIVRFNDLQVDWGRTRAWGDGGYYGRVFLNVSGREPEGIVRPADYEILRDELSGKLALIPDPEGGPLDTTVYRPSEIYRQVNGVAPDLMVYFGNLLWRSVGSLGHGAVHSFENDTGPDDCNHAQNGLFILHDPKREEAGGHIDGARIFDVASTVLDIFQIPAPHELQGVSLRGVPQVA